MATTGSNILLVTASTLEGTTYTTQPYISLADPKEAMTQSLPTQPIGGSGSLVASKAAVQDRVVFDHGLTAIPAAGTPLPNPDASGTYIGAFAKNGGILLSLSGTTPQTIDLTDLTANTPAGTIGDTAFSKINSIVFNNSGAGAVVVTTGATTPAGLPAFNATSSGVTAAAGSCFADYSKAGVTVDSTHKLIVVTPAATTTLVVSIGGS